MKHQHPQAGVFDIGEPHVSSLFQNTGQARHVAIRLSNVSKSTISFRLIRPNQIRRADQTRSHPWREDTSVNRPPRTRAAHSFRRCLTPGEDNAALAVSLLNTLPPNGLVQLVIGILLDKIPGSVQDVAPLRELVHGLGFRLALADQG